MLLLCLDFFGAFDILLLLFSAFQKSFRFLVDLLSVIKFPAISAIISFFCLFTFDRSSNGSFSVTVRSAIFRWDWTSVNILSTFDSKSTENVQIIHHENKISFINIATIHNLTVYFHFA